MYHNGLGHGEGTKLKTYKQTPRIQPGAHDPRTTHRRTPQLARLVSSRKNASTAFYPCLTVQLLDRLVKIFKSGIRAVFQVPSTTPSSPLLCRLDLLTLTQIYKQKLLFFVHRCLGTEMISNLFSTFFDLVNGRATRGQASRLSGFVSRFCRVLPVDPLFSSLVVCTGTACRLMSAPSQFLLHLRKQLQTIS